MTVFHCFCYIHSLSRFSPETWVVGQAWGFNSVQRYASAAFIKPFKPIQKETAEKRASVQISTHYFLTCRKKNN